MRLIGGGRRRCRQAAERGEGVVLLDGVLVENLHVANARRVVGMAEAITAQVRVRVSDRGGAG